MLYWIDYFYGGCPQQTRCFTPIEQAKRWIDRTFGELHIATDLPKKNGEYCIKHTRGI